MQLFVDFMSAIGEGDEKRAKFIAEEINRREKLFLSELKEVATQIPEYYGYRIIAATERFFLTGSDSE